MERDEVVQEVRDPVCSGTPQPRLQSSQGREVVHEEIAGTQRHGKEPRHESTPQCGGQGRPGVVAQVWPAVEWDSHDEVGGGSRGAASGTVDGRIRVMGLQHRMGNQMVPVELGAAANSWAVEHHASGAVANSRGDSSVGPLVERKDGIVLLRQHGGGGNPEVEVVQRAASDAPQAVPGFHGNNGRVRAVRRTRQGG